MTRQEAVRRAVEAVRRYEREGHAWSRENAVEALEDALGPLDWSLGGEGFRLLRQVADRAFGPGWERDRLRNGRPSVQERDLGFWDSTSRARRSAQKLLREGGRA